MNSALPHDSDSYQTLFDNIPIPAFVYDPETLKLVRWNEAALRDYGITVAQAQALYMHEWLSPSEVDRLRQYVASLAPGARMRANWRLHLPDGRQVDVETSSHEVIIEGRPLRVAIARDITEQMSVERAMAESRQALEAAVATRTAELRQMVEELRREVAERNRVEVALQQGRRDLQMNERFLNSSQQLARLGHWQHDVVLGKSEWSNGAYHVLGMVVGEEAPSFEAFLRRVHPDDRSRLRNAQYYKGATDPTWQDEYRVVLPGGAIRYVRELGEATYGRDGKLLRLLGIVQDVTGTRELERQLESRRVFLREIIDSLPIYIAVRDRRGRNIILNKAAAETFGWAVSPDDEEPSASDVARFERENAEVLLEGRDESRVDECVQDAHGHLRYIATTQRLIDGPDGPGEYVLSLAIDTTERRQDELRRREIEKLAATGRMAARVAHEINNPLAGIKASFHLLKDEIPASSPHLHFVPRIEREINRIAGIVRQMFDLYRPLQEGPESTDVDMLLDDVAHLVETQLRERALRLEVESAPRGARVAVDDAVLRPVVYNLLQNAIEASSSGMVVRVRAAVTPDALQIEVSDQGSGIPAALHTRVFEPFFTTKSGLVTGGLGLGLSIARSSVESMNGALTFESDPGKGTTFTVVIPVLRESQGRR